MMDDVNRAEIGAGRINAGSSSASPAPVAPFGALKGTRVWVVDDIEDHLDLYSFLLGAAAAEYRTFDGWEVARSRLFWSDDPRPDLLVVDLRMPLIHGCDAIREVRASGWTVPILVSSASVTFADIDEAMTAGANAFLAKPFDVRHFIQACSTLLRLAGQSVRAAA